MSIALSEVCEARIFRALENYSKQCMQRIEAANKTKGKRIALVKQAHGNIETRTGKLHTQKIPTIDIACHL